MAIIELRVLAGQCLNRRIETAAQLEIELAARNKDRSARGGCVRWQFTTADARIKLRRLYPTI